MSQSVPVTHWGLPLTPAAANIPASQPLKRPMNDRLLVRVTTGIDRKGDPVITLWVVATTNRQAVVAIVREANPSRAERRNLRAVNPERVSSCGCDRPRRADCEVLAQLRRRPLPQGAVDQVGRRSRGMCTWLVTGGERNLLPNSSIRTLRQKPQQRFGCRAKIAVAAVDDGDRNRGAHRWNVERH